MPHPGELLGGRYRLDDRIGAGGMGEVWQATDTVLGRAVAVKTLHADRATDPDFQRRFRHEARALAALRHPGVVPVYDFDSTAPKPADGDDGGSVACADGAYLVMARVDGQPLNRILADRGRLTPAETMSIVAQAARALDSAHGVGIVHRDVKPGNLLIEPDGTVVLVDFGVARSAHSGTLSGAREVVGTALYIAPEQVTREATGPAADVYALGAVAFHCLTGHPPFQGGNPIAIALQHLEDEPPPLPDDVSAEVGALVRTALAKNPEERFPSAGAMADAAEAAGSQRADGLEVTRAGVPWLGVAAIGAGRGDDDAVVSRPPETERLDATEVAGPGPAESRPSGDESGQSGLTGRQKRLVPIMVLAAVALLGIGALVVADPLGFFGDGPRPATSTPATPGSSAPRSTGTGTRDGGGAAEQEAVQQDSTPQKKQTPTRTSSPTATRPAATSTSTTPTREATATSTTSAPEQTPTTGESGQPDEDEAG